MAATLISRASAVAEQFRKAVSATALVLAPDGVSRFDATTAPTITAGAGAPTEASPDGSVYLRTDGGIGTSTYQRISGTWTPFA